MATAIYTLMPFLKNTYAPQTTIQKKTLPMFVWVAVEDLYVNHHNRTNRVSQLWWLNRILNSNHSCASVGTWTVLILAVAGKEHGHEYATLPPDDVLDRAVEVCMPGSGFLFLGPKHHLAAKILQSMASGISLVLGQNVISLCGVVFWVSMAVLVLTRRVLGSTTSPSSVSSRAFTPVVYPNCGSLKHKAAQTCKSWPTLLSYVVL